MSFLLINLDDNTVVWQGDTQPAITDTQADCGDVLYLCFSSLNAISVENETLEDFLQGKYSYEGGEVILNPLWEPEALPEEVVTVPSEVTQRQAKEELIDIDLIDTVEAFLDAIPDPKQKRIGLNWYNNSQTFMRNNPFLNYVWTALGKTQEELDNLFINASKR